MLIKKKKSKEAETTEYQINRSQYLKDYKAREKFRNPNLRAVYKPLKVKIKTSSSFKDVVDFHNYLEEKYNRSLEELVEGGIYPDKENLDKWKKYVSNRNAKKSV